MFVFVFNWCEFGIALIWYGVDLRLDGRNIIVPADDLPLEVSNLLEQRSVLVINELTLATVVAHESLVVGVLKVFTGLLLDALDELSDVLQSCLPLGHKVSLESVSDLGSAGGVADLGELVLDFIVPVLSHLVSEFVGQKLDVLVIADHCEELGNLGVVVRVAFPLNVNKVDLLSLVALDVGGLGDGVVNLSGLDLDVLNFGHGIVSLEDVLKIVIDVGGALLSLGFHGLNLLSGWVSEGLSGWSFFKFGVERS